MPVYPHSRLFVGPAYTVLISGPHIQVVSSATGDLLHSTSEFSDDKKSAVLKSGPVRCAAVDSSYKYLATAGEDKMLKVWEIEGLALSSERELPKKPTGLRFTSDAQTILISDKFGDIFSYPFTYIPLTMKQKRDALSSHENPSGGQLILGHASPLNAFLLTSDEKYIVTADRDEHVRVSWYPQGYIIERYCLGHHKFVSAIHIPKSDSATLISGGGDPVLKVWDWMAGAVKHEINVLDVVEPFIVIRAVKRKRGERDDDGEGGAEVSKARHKKGKGKGKGKGKEEAENIEMAINEEGVRPETTDISAEVEEEKETPGEAPEGAPTEPEKILVIHRIEALDSENGPYIVFSAVGSTALFAFPYRADVVPSEVQSFDFGKPVIDFSLTEDAHIWVTLDGEFTSKESSSFEPEKMIKVLTLMDGKLTESSFKEAFLAAIETNCALLATADDLKRLDLYSDLISMPKYSESEPTEAAEAPSLADAPSMADNPKSKKELGRLKSKQAVQAKMQATGSLAGKPVVEDDIEEPESKRTKPEHGDDNVTGEKSVLDDVVTAE